MRQPLHFLPLLGLCLAMACGGSSGGSKTNTAGKGASPAATAGSASGGKSCGTVDCMPGLWAVDNGEACCVDASKSLCGTKAGAGMCKALKRDSRCPSLMARIGEFPGCCTEDNMCGVDTMGLAGWGCLPLSTPMLRMNEPNAPAPRACDAP